MFVLFVVCAINFEYLSDILVMNLVLLLLQKYVSETETVQYFETILLRR